MLLFKEKGISGAWRSGLRKTVRAEDMLANYMLKHCLPVQIVVPNSVAFFVLVWNCIILHREDLLL